MFVPIFKILGQVLLEKSLKKKVYKHTHRKCKNYIPPIYSGYPLLVLDKIPWLFTDFSLTKFHFSLTISPLITVTYSSPFHNFSSTWTKAICMVYLNFKTKILRIKALQCTIFTLEWKLKMHMKKVKKAWIIFERFKKISRKTNKIEKKLINGGHLFISLFTSFWQRWCAVSGALSARGDWGCLSTSKILDSILCLTKLSFFRTPLSDFEMLVAAWSGYYLCIYRGQIQAPFPIEISSKLCGIPEFCNFSLEFSLPITQYFRKL